MSSLLHDSSLPPQSNIEAIYADGYCLIGPNSYGYARITDKNRNSLVHYFEDPDLTFAHLTTPLGTLTCVQVRSEDTPQQQIQYAEITALYMALKVALMLSIPLIYTDSVTANAWSSGRINCKINDLKKLKMCNDAANLRKLYENKGYKITIIEGKNNPADFGYHNKNVVNNLSLQNNGNNRNNESVINNPNLTNSKESVACPYTVVPPSNILGHTNFHNNENSDLNTLDENKNDNINSLDCHDILVSKEKVDSMRYIKLCADSYEFYHSKILNKLISKNIKLNSLFVIGFIISNSDISKSRYGWNTNDLVDNLTEKIASNHLEIDDKWNRIIKELPNVELRLKINLLEPKIQKKLVMLAITNLKKTSDYIDDLSDYYKIAEYIEFYLNVEFYDYNLRLQDKNQNIQ